MLFVFILVTSTWHRIGRWTRQQHWGQSQRWATIPTIRLQNVFVSQTEALSPGGSVSPAPSPATGPHHLLSVSTNLTPPRISCEWNHSVFALSCLTYFSSYNVFTAHPCCEKHFFLIIRSEKGKRRTKSHREYKSLVNISVQVTYPNQISAYSSPWGRDACTWGF